MRKPSSTRETIRCRYFTWLLYRRNQTYYADGRGNHPSQGRRSLGTNQRTEALEILEELDFKKGVGAGKATETDCRERQPDPEAASIAAGIEAYKTYANRPAIAHGVRPSTWRRYQGALNGFATFCRDTGITTWNAVTKETLCRYARRLEGLHREISTQAYSLRTIKQVHNWLVEEKLLPETLRLRYAIRASTESEAYCWTTDEFQAILRRCQSLPKFHWLGDICFALGTTGMRIDELVHLRWTDVDLGRNCIRLVDESHTTRIPKTKRRTLKTGRGREIPIQHDLRKLLERLACHPDGFVFRTADGRRINQQMVRDAFVRNVVTPLKDEFPPQSGKKRFEDGRLHTFRHFFCSTCANSGIPEAVVMKWLGHTTPTMTRRYYHLAHDESRHQMERLAVPSISKD